MTGKELDIKKEELQLKKSLKVFFRIIIAQTETIPANVDKQVGMLFKLRSEVYEQLNQIQHRWLIIKVAKILKKESPQINFWRWHPEQTSSPIEADLTGYVNGQVFVSAEVTTSPNPIGTIDKRMEKTLRSLNKKEGKRYYFVQTEKMLMRAVHKIKSNNWNIVVQKIESKE
jgi:hypothetical protein